MRRSKDAADLSLASAVTMCHGVGPKTRSVLERIGIVTVEDLLHHFPRTHLDRRTIAPIASLSPPCSAVVKGEMGRIRSFRASRRLHITECPVHDATGVLIPSIPLLPEKVWRALQAKGGARSG